MMFECSVLPRLVLAAVLLPMAVCAASSAACKGTNEGEGGRIECRDVILPVNTSEQCKQACCESSQVCIWHLACASCCRLTRPQAR